MIGRGRERRAADRGVVSVLSVFFVLLLITFLAVSINLGRLMTTRGDLQHAADSAALAAAGALEQKATPTSGPALPDGRRSGDFDIGPCGAPGSCNAVQEVAKEHAAAFVLRDGPAAHPDVVITTDVRFGFWHVTGPETCAFDSSLGCDPGWEPAPAAFPDPANVLHWFSVNAVQVSTHYPLPPYFGNWLGIGTKNMTARATAFGRRTRVPCAIPTSVSICQIVGQDPMQAGFSCPGGVIHRTFSSNEWMDPNALGRIDLVNQWVPDDFMRNYTRSEDFDHCLDDATTSPTPVTEYAASVGRMTGQPRGNLQPVVEGLLGINVQDGGQQANRCLLGKKLVIPVIQPDGIQTPADCTNQCAPSTVVQPLPPTAPPGTPAGCIPWPATSMQRVVGFVNIKFTKVHCWHEASPHADGRAFVQTTLTDANCESATDNDPDHLGESLATNCSGDLNMNWAWQKDIQLEADITCDAPVGPLDLAGNPIPQTTFKTRLVQ